MLCLVLYACTSTPDKDRKGVNPAATGFDPKNSDPAGVELADSIMAAMGGRAAWDDTRYITWTSGKRKITWDKHEGRVRIDLPDSTIYLLNLNTNEGRIQIKGKEEKDPAAVKRYLEKAKHILLNDSYALVMPFKLKEAGVTLRYLGTDLLETGVKCNVLQLTFSNHSREKYLVYADLSDNLVKQWAYYREATQDSATFVLPWDNYKRYGALLLSADRTGGKGPRDVRIDETLPDNIFNEFY